MTQKQITGHTGNFRRASLFDTNIENLDMVVENGNNTYGESGEIFCTIVEKQQFRPVTVPKLTILKIAKSE